MVLLKLESIMINLLIIIIKLFLVYILICIKIQKMVNIFLCNNWYIYIYIYLIIYMFSINKIIKNFKVDEIVLNKGKNIFYY